MALIYNNEQRLLKDTAANFFTTRAPVAQLRKLRDENNPLGYSQSLWQSMVELGWAGIILPEQYGGLDFGFVGLGAILEQSGQTLAASPLFATMVLGASVLMLGADDRQKQQWLPSIAAGETTMALALEEGPHHAPNCIAVQAIPHHGGFLLQGKKTFVIDGHSADKLVVVARSSGNVEDHHGITLLLVDNNATGVHCTRTTTIDSRNAATIDLNNVFVDNTAIIGTIDKGWELLDAVLDRGRICCAVEMLGITQECFNRTVNYLKTREQFGVKIGSFQALKHRAAIMYTEVELCRSLVMDALSAIDDQRTDIALMASLTKARLNETCKRITNEAIQMHGGIGITDELDIGLFLKRARVTAQIFGDVGYHQNRYATQRGY